MAANPQDSGLSGQNMTDTIELLSIIGQDATLRHASVEDLGAALDQAHASETLKAAVAARDSSLLARELGNKPRTEPQISHLPGHDSEQPGPEEGQPGEEREQTPRDPASAV